MMQNRVLKKTFHASTGIEPMANVAAETYKAVIKKHPVLTKFEPLYLAKPSVVSKDGKSLVKSSNHSYYSISKLQRNPPHTY